MGCKFHEKLDGMAHEYVEGGVMAPYALGLVAMRHNIEPVWTPLWEMLAQMVESIESCKVHALAGGEKVPQGEEKTKENGMI